MNTSNTENFLKIYQIDAFAETLFSGNPAAVVPLENWLEDDLMQKIAAENNLAETAFIVPSENGFEIRWFTPVDEVDLCGHATLASAFVLHNFENYGENIIYFHSRKSGTLVVTKTDDFYTLDFPADCIEKVENNGQFDDFFAYPPTEIIKGKTDYLLVFENEDQIKNITPDFNKISKVEVRGIIVTSQSENFDFVSRFFASPVGVDEDPVTGSAHTTLIPYWSKVLNKNKFSAKQISQRGGILNCELQGNRVLISGKCVPYLIGKIFI